jgi:hypothetical protein
LDLGLSGTPQQRTRDKVRMQNQLEALLEEAHIKLSSLVSDLLGASARRMLKALADGETDPAAEALVYCSSTQGTLLVGSSPESMEGLKGVHNF